MEFELARLVKFLVLLKIVSVEPAVDVVEIRIIFYVFIFKNSFVVVHVFGFGEVWAFLVCHKMQGFGNNFTSNVYVGVVEHVRHWNHRAVRDAPAEAPGANLGVQRQKVLSCASLFIENLWVLL